MSTEAEKNKSIAAQTAAKAAGEILHGTGASPEQVTNLLEAIYQKIVEVAPITDQPAVAPAAPAAPVAAVAAPVTPQQAQQNVVQAFPGAQVIPQPQGLHAGSPEKDQWADLLANPGNWWDNREKGDTSINGGKKPDFRHKSLEKDGNKLALWLNGKFGPAPQWVWERLGYQPPVTQQQVAQQQVAQAPVPTAPPAAPPASWGPDQAPF